MEIWIVRHGDPDYVHDSLTEKGVREAKLLAERLVKTDFSAVYCSTMGRARQTASYYLEKSGREATYCKWLHEFKGSVKIDGRRESCWDRKPAYWTAIDTYYQAEEWMKTELMQTDNTERKYRYVCCRLDALLAQHGYEKQGRLYHAVRPNDEKILLFCHFGVESVILSHLFSVSPMPLWHHFVALPTSVTRVVTEEREQGKAIFRCLYYGDISHLYAGGEPLSFQARFCEQFTDDTRH